MRPRLASSFPPPAMPRSMSNRHLREAGCDLLLRHLFLNSAPSGQIEVNAGYILVTHS